MREGKKSVGTSTHDDDLWNPISEDFYDFLCGFDLENAANLPPHDSE